MNDYRAHRAPDLEGDEVNMAARLEPIAMEEIDGEKVHQFLVPEALWEQAD